VTGHVWKGSAFDGVKGRTELPGIVDDYLAGKLWVDQFVTHTQGLEDINKGFEDMKVGLGMVPFHPIELDVCARQ
jgi:S-(hydroxymethyl)glutathione dehydrogenase/alcohol dehydrogenase